VDTPRFLDALEWGERGVVYSQSFQGGIRMRALTRRVASGDPHAYARAAVLARPDGRPLTWIMHVSDRELQVPSSADAARALDLTSLGAYMSARGRDRTALGCFGEAIKLDPDLCDAYVGRGELHLGADRAAQALDDFDYALGLCPDHTRASDGRTLADAVLNGRDAVPLISAEDGSEIPAEVARRAGAGTRAAATAKKESGRIPDLVERTFPVSGPVDVAEHLVRLTVGFDASYSVVKAYSPPSALVVKTEAFYDLSAPLTLTWSYRNRLRIDAAIPASIKMLPIETPNYMILGITGGVDRASLKLEYLLHSDERAGNSLLVTTNYLFPGQEHFFEEYLNDHGNDLKGCLSWRQPYAFAMLGLMYETSLSPQLRLIPYASVAAALGEDPNDEDGPWGLLEGSFNWGVGAAAQFIFAGDSAFFGGLEFGVTHAGFGTGVGEYASIRSDQISIALINGEKHSYSRNQVGVAFTTAQDESGAQTGRQTSLFFVTGSNFEFHLIDKWF
ncbi:hypothetical protein KAW64_03305, partial [bacterium]|nr:hypothetical protein [bacterium]